MSNHQKGNNSESFFCSMGELVAELGKGVAEAQQDMDRQAIETYRQILADEELTEYGITPSWFTIPEATLQLKMSYSVVKKEDSGSGGSTNPPKSKRRLLVSPSNATYKNLFNQSESTQSELNLKIISVPPPTKVTGTIYMPELIGKSYVEAKLILENAGLVIKGEAPSSGNAIVKTQLPEAGKEVRFKEEVTLTFLPQGDI